MIKTKWIDFTIYDISFNDEITYTQEKFEDMVQDKFIALELEDEEIKYIWTEKFVFAISRRARLMGQLAIVGAPRNPDWRGENV